MQSRKIQGKPVGAPGKPVGAPGKTSRGAGPPALKETDRGAHLVLVIRGIQYKSKATTTIEYSSLGKMGPGQVRRGTIFGTWIPFPSLGNGKNGIVHYKLSLQ